MLPVIGLIQRDRFALGSRSTISDCPVQLHLHGCRRRLVRIQGPDLRYAVVAAVYIRGVGNGEMLRFILPGLHRRHRRDHVLQFAGFLHLPNIARFEVLPCVSPVVIPIQGDRCAVLLPIRSVNAVIQLHLHRIRLCLMSGQVPHLGDGIIRLFCLGRIGKHQRDRTGRLIGFGGIRGDHMINGRYFLHGPGIMRIQLAEAVAPVVAFIKRDLFAVRNRGVAALCPVQLHFDLLFQGRIIVLQVPVLAHAVLLIDDVCSVVDGKFVVFAVLYRAAAGDRHARGHIDFFHLPLIAGLQLVPGMGPAVVHIQRDFPSVLRPRLAVDTVEQLYIHRFFGLIFLKGPRLLHGIVSFFHIAGIGDHKGKVAPVRCCRGIDHHD